ncbi:putative esterase of the alpha-beta hydrolase superfamily [Burkholderiales bacterium JOSHI_001]|nr:putative esterase of the alpha-beta hydrolase superfamily [Burkholderiales bacterium JOSHI_001]
MSATLSHALPWRRRLFTAAGLALLGTGGCSLRPGADHDGDDAPAALALRTRPRVAWVFGSGGPRGFVHVGVVKALAALDLHPDLIVGASAGAVVGVLVAAGLPAAQIEALALELRPWQLLRLTLAGNTWFSGEALADLLRTALLPRVGSMRIEHLPTPFAAAAQRLPAGPVVAFTHGDIGTAVRASAAVEGELAPVRIRGVLYGDPDLHMPLPVRLARSLGAERVLAVDVSAYEDRAPPGTEAWREGDLRKRALTRPDAELADLLLHPDTGYYAGFNRAYRERCIAVGLRDTLAAAAALQALHAHAASGAASARKPG